MEKDKYLVNKFLYLLGNPECLFLAKISAPQLGSYSIYDLECPVWKMV